MHRILRRVAWVLVLLAPPVYVLVGEDLDHQSRQQASLERIQRRNRQLSAEIDDLKRRIVALREDERYLERVAREELGWIRDGETVYRVPAPPKPPRRAPPQ